MESIFDLLECSVCLERLDASSRILPCQHTFCVRCLATILKTNNDLRCPECREPVPVTDVKELPTNILLVRILDGLVKPPGTSHTEAHANTSSTGVKSPPSNVFKPLQPFARAKFSYDRKETGDLSFNKGDIIFLKKKLDDNWYVGEVNGQTGFFPANHVEVIHPLQEVTPKCKALYDFEVAENEEKDILTFNKDEVLKVIRRVDDNWVEGQKGDKIGIFPISFVEFNDPAKTLIEIQQGASHHSPQSSGSSGEGHHSPQSSGSSGEGNTEHGAAGVSSRQGGNRSKSSAKRHSFTSVLGVVQLRPNQENRTNGPSRHSMEISPPELVRSSNPIAATLLEARQQGPTNPPISSSPSATAVTTVTTTTTQETGSRTNRKKPPPLAAVPQVLLGGGSLPGSPSALIQDRGTATSPRPNVEVYKARYAYKPQHPDELEVSIGEVFTVYDFCSDGWFRGMSLSSGKTGVFPGNYMEPYRITDDSRVSSPVSSSPGPYLFPTSSHPSNRSKSNSSNATQSNSNATQSAGKGAAKAAMKSPSILQHDNHKTVAQLQNERNKQQQILREMTQKSNNSQSSPSTIAASPPVMRRKSSSSRNKWTMSSSKRPLSGTGVPLSVLERMMHENSGPEPSDTNLSTRNGFRRHGARGRSKSASRLSSKMSDGGNNSSSPDEGGHSHQVEPSCHSTPHSSMHDIAPSSTPQQSFTQTLSERFRPRRYSEGERDARLFRSLLQRVVHGNGESAPSCHSDCSACHHQIKVVKATAGHHNHHHIPPSPSHLAVNGYTSSLPFASASKTTACNHRYEKKGGREKTRRKSTSSDQSQQQQQPCQGPPPPVRHSPPPSVHDPGDTSVYGAAGGNEMVHNKEEEGPPKTLPLAREKYRVLDSYPAYSDMELALNLGDIIFVHKKREDGWYKGTSHMSGKTGLFPGSFVEKL